MGSSMLWLYLTAHFLRISRITSDGRGRALLLLMMSGVYIDSASGADFPAIADPTKPIGESAAPEQNRSNSWKLQGIFDYSGHSMAVVNGKNVFVGDSVNGAKVVSIRKNTVIVVSGVERITLTLRKSVLKPIDQRTH